MHGHICDCIKALYASKNHDYGNAFSLSRKEVPFYTLGILYNKFNRLKTLLVNGEDTRLVNESVDDTLMDIANYCIMELTERYLDREKENEG